MNKKTAVDLDKREKTFRQWVLKHCPSPITHITNLVSNSAGFRRYFRLHLENNTTLIAVDSPCNSDNNQGFVALSAYFHSLNIPVPIVLAYQKHHGFLLVNDAGNTTLEEASLEQPDLTYSLYQTAIDTLVELQCKTQKTPSIKFTIPTFDKTHMIMRFNLFIQWFLRDFLQLTYDEISDAKLSDLFELTYQAALNQPSVLVHMDYQCRNLLVGKQSKITILDFQDAMIGPISYDIVSLLWDCYLDFPENQVKTGISYYFDQCAKHHLIDPVDQTIQQHWFYTAAILRHFKNLFIFARKALRDDDHHYLIYLPRIAHYIERALANFPELAEQYQWWKKVVLPKIEQL